MNLRQLSRAFPLAVECDDLHTLSRLAMDGDLLALLPHGLAAELAIRECQALGADWPGPSPLPAALAIARKPD